MNYNVELWDIFIMFLVICIAVIGRKGSFCVTETVIVCTYIMEGIRKNIVKRQA